MPKKRATELVNSGLKTPASAKINNPVQNKKLPKASLPCLTCITTRLKTNKRKKERNV